MVCHNTFVALPVTVIKFEIFPRLHFGIFTIRAADFRASAYRTRKEIRLCSEHVKPDIIDYFLCSNDIFRLLVLLRC